MTSARSLLQISQAPEKPFDRLEKPRCQVVERTVGIGHTLPYLIGDFALATGIAIVVVLIELWAIAWVRSHYMETKFLRAAFEVVVGGLIVFTAGILIGSA